MKIFFSILAILISFMSSPDAQSAEAKSHGLPCKTEDQAWDARLGTNVVVPFNAGIQRGNLQTSFVVTTGQCTKTKSGFDVVMVPPYTANIVKHELNKDIVRISPLEIELQAYIDGKYELLINHRIDQSKEDKTFLVLDSQIPINKLLSAEEQTRLRKDKHLELTLTVFLKKELRIENLSKNLSSDQEVSSQRFPVRIGLKLDGPSLSASLIKPEAPVHTGSRAELSEEQELESANAI